MCAAFQLDYTQINCSVSFKAHSTLEMQICFLFVPWSCVWWQGVVLNLMCECSFVKSHKTQSSHSADVVTSVYRCVYVCEPVPLPAEPPGNAQPGSCPLWAHQGSPRQRAAGDDPRPGEPALAVQREVDAGDQTAEPEEVPVHARGAVRPRHPHHHHAGEEGQKQLRMCSVSHSNVSWSTTYFQLSFRLACGKNNLKCCV